MYKLEWNMSISFEEDSDNSYDDEKNVHMIWESKKRDFVVRYNRPGMFICISIPVDDCFVLYPIIGFKCTQKLELIISNLLSS